MVLSCLVEPLVPPLVCGTSGRGRRTRLLGSRLTSTALVATALAAVMTLAGRQTEDSGTTSTIARTAHRPPKPITTTMVFARVAKNDEDDPLRAPSESPKFEWDAVEAHRLRHSRNIARDEGPSLGLGHRLARLTATDATYLRFASGQHHSGPPSLASTASST